jgi:hypothetical protein
MNDRKVLELKTTVEVEKSMKLVDINGKKINFQSECIVTPTSDEPFYIAIVNQNDLDNGDINFEVCKGGFSRRVTYESEDDEHINHYIAFKKLPSTDEKKLVKPNVIVRLTELDKPQKTPVFLPNEPIMSMINEPSHGSSHGPISTPLPSPSSSLSSSLSSSPSLTNQIDPRDVEMLKEKLYELSLSNDYNNQSALYRNIAIGCFIVVILFVILKK